MATETHSPGFTGVWLPASIFLHPEITPHEQRLWATIASLQVQRGYCFASNAWLAERIGVSRSRVEAMLVKLRKLQVLVTRDSGEVRKMVAVEPGYTPPPLRDSNPPPLRDSGPIVENKDESKAKKGNDGPRSGEPSGLGSPKQAELLPGEEPKPPMVKLKLDALPEEEAPVGEWQRRFLAAWCEAFKTKFGTAYDVAGKDAAAAKRLHGRGHRIIDLIGIAIAAWNMKEGRNFFICRQAVQVSGLEGNLSAIKLALKDAQGASSQPARPSAVIGGPPPEQTAEALAFIDQVNHEQNERVRKRLWGPGGKFEGQRETMFAHKNETKP